MLKHFYVTDYTNHGAAALTILMNQRYAPEGYELVAVDRKGGRLWYVLRRDATPAEQALHLARVAGFDTRLAEGRI